MIKTTINVMDRATIYDSMSTALRESILCCDQEYMTWYSDCSFDDYYVELEELWDNETNEHIGNGISCGWFSVVVNDDTKCDLEEIFEEARADEYERVLKEFQEKTEGCACEDMTANVITFEDSEEVQIEGYEYAGDVNEFVEYNKFYIELCNHTDVTIDEYAGYMGYVKAETSKGTLYFKKN